MVATGGTGRNLLRTRDRQRVWDLWSCEEWFRYGLVKESGSDMWTDLLGGRRGAVDFPPSHELWIRDGAPLKTPTLRSIGQASLWIPNWTGLSLDCGDFPKCVERRLTVFGRPGSPTGNRQRSPWSGRSLVWGGSGFCPRWTKRTSAFG